MLGCPPIFSPQRFRDLVVTDLPSQDAPLEDVQYLAGHANPTTTQIYDRRRRRVTRDAECCGENFFVRVALNSRNKTPRSQIETVASTQIMV